jgi:phosphopantothenoylcysteine decarboxylase/phosphopantothenate--cysteine ligase
VLLMAAAVADYSPAAVAPQKIKKEKTDLTLRLARTPDILAAVAAQRAESGFPRAVVGFAAETQDLVENARAKLAAKGLDLIVANDVTAQDAGFGAETNRVSLISREGAVETLPLLSKSAVAEAVLECVAGILEGTKDERRRTEDEGRAGNERA